MTELPWFCVWCVMPINDEAQLVTDPLGAHWHRACAEGKEKTIVPAEEQEAMVPAEAAKE